MLQFNVLSLQYVLNVVRGVHNNNHNLATATLATYHCSYINLILDKNHITTTTNLTTTKCGFVSKKTCYSTFNES